MNSEKISNRSSPREAHPDIRIGIFIMVLSVICFTANTLFLKYLGSIRSVDPFVALLFRSVVGAMIVIAFFRGKRPLEILPIFRDRGLIYRGLAGIIGTTAYYVTIPTLGSGKATLLCNTYVLFAAIIASIFLGEKLSRRRFAWMALAFVGITILMGNKNGPADASNNGLLKYAELIGLIGAVAAAIAVVLIRNLTIRYSNGTIFMAQCLWVLLATAPLAIKNLKSLDPTDVIFLSLSAALAAFGQLAMNEGFRRLTVAGGASIQMAWPVLTAAGGFLLFGEMFSPLQITGAVMIIIGIWRVTVRK